VRDHSSIAACRIPQPYHPFLLGARINRASARLSNFESPPRARSYRSARADLGSFMQVSRYSLSASSDAVFDIERVTADRPCQHRLPLADSSHSESAPTAALVEGAESKRSTTHRKPLIPLRFSPQSASSCCLDILPLPTVMFSEHIIMETAAGQWPAIESGVPRCTSHLRIGINEIPKRGFCGDEVQWRDRTHAIRNLEAQLVHDPGERITPFLRELQENRGLNGETLIDWLHRQSGIASLLANKVNGDPSFARYLPKAFRRAIQHPLTVT